MHNLLAELRERQRPEFLDRRTVVKHGRQQLDLDVRTLAGIAAWGQLRSSGRDASAIADALIAFGHDKTWRQPFLELAEQAAAQVERDWRKYADAYKAGVIAPT